MVGIKKLMDKWLKQLAQTYGYMAEIVSLNQRTDNWHI